ncbi:type II secretion system protein GspC [Shewanella glacialipiscicola]|uniref:Type II secretion system protein GspC n=1 Tax=Shewanella glacialipiscicola TaxID=614069 RepID=A0ABQ6JA84_9GAMM|nr:type II secretion system protein GspC [Shewanella glacialipiscicola]MCL1087384.1 type II secretion system protein GspC [Shewanella glacialipiscicola]MCU7995880.1 type II secretion system protein GspC [Shewanella glacialipiscicola]MCU8027133.1 type II secretion system protein GspC [Shewanella glacialipiscicola]GIU11602.1 type II secretion system protein GspC [Shewanella glacialipiscicola]GMA84080.1 type II secretion system protein GspC [Shewanella glacialipiscicola]
MDLLDKIIAKAIGMPHKPLSRIVFWLGFIVIMLLAAQITWKLVPTDSSVTAWSPTPVNVNGKDVGQVDLAGLQQLGLFGKADTQSDRPKVAAVETITDAPKTSLSIQLTGVVASTTDQKGLAVIESNGSQETYSLGDKIKGTSASLKEVYADRIIITNAGRYETLMLDGLVYTSQSPANQQLQQAKSNTTVNRIDQRKNAEVSQELAESRTELLADPSKITDYIAISPVRQGDAVAGYRLNPGKDANLFKQAGFKANDLAKSINGYDLTVMSQALEMMSQLSELTEVSIMVEREGQLVEIMFSLPQ